MEACVVNRQPQTALAVFDDMLEQVVESDTVSLTLTLTLSLTLTLTLTLPELYPYPYP